MYARMAMAITARAPTVPPTAANVFEVGAFNVAAGPLELLLPGEFGSDEDPEGYVPVI